MKTETEQVDRLSCCSSPSRWSRNINSRTKSQQRFDAIIFIPQNMLYMFKLILYNMFISQLCYVFSLFKCWKPVTEDWLYTNWPIQPKNNQLKVIKLHVGFVRTWKQFWLILLQRSWCQWNSYNKSCWCVLLRAIKWRSPGFNYPSICEVPGHWCIRLSAALLNSNEKGARLI